MEFILVSGRSIGLRDLPRLGGCSVSSAVSGHGRCSDKKEIKNLMQVKQRKNRENSEEEIDKEKRR